MHDDGQEKYPRCGEPTRRVVKYEIRNIDDAHLTHMRCKVHVHSVECGARAFVRAINRKNSRMNSRETTRFTHTRARARTRAQVRMHNRLRE